MGLACKLRNEMKYKAALGMACRTEFVVNVYETLATILESVHRASRKTN